MFVLPVVYGLELFVHAAQRVYLEHVTSLLRPKVHQSQLFCLRFRQSWVVGVNIRTISHPSFGFASMTIDHSCAEMTALLVCGNLPLMPKFFKLMARRGRSMPYVHHKEQLRQYGARLRNAPRRLGARTSVVPWLQLQDYPRSQLSGNYLPLDGLDMQKARAKSGSHSRFLEDEVYQHPYRETEIVASSIQRTVHIHTLSTLG